MNFMQLTDLKNHHAVVTGSAEGIGQAISGALQAQGCIVYGLDISPDAPRTGMFWPIRCDLRDPNAIEAAIKDVAGATGGRLDHVVNNAGIDPRFTIGDGGAGRWDEVFDLNVRAYQLIIRAALPLLRKGEGKSIVNLSSLNYRIAPKRRSIYSSSKAAILGITTGMARELGAEGIRINTVTPGWVFTQRQVAEYFTDPAERPKHLAYLEQSQSLHMHLRPEHIANHVLFYLSSASDGSTGHNCVADAGWLLE
jgi:NAD(P)-dependent dehydrogenase (short-subunit alcohol dehydrogenase family)